MDFIPILEIIEGDIYGEITSCFSDDQFMYICGWIAIVFIVTGIAFCAARRYSCSLTDYTCAICNLLQLLSSLKSVIRPKNRHFWQHAASNYTQSLCRAGNGIIAAKHHFVEISHKLDSNGIAVLIAPNDKEYLVRKSTRIRPKQPPPPPPSFPSRSAVDKALLPSINIVSPYPPKGPPPLPIKSPNLSLEMIITGCDSSTYEMPNTTRKRLSSLVRSNTVNYSQSSEHYTDYYDSISRKFDDDFDEDFDDDGLFSESQNDEKQQEPIQYTVIVPMKERLLAQEEKVKSVTLHHLEQIAKSSFSSDKSRSEPYPSDDTISTGLSEEGERFASVTDIVRKFNGGKY